MPLNAAKGAGGSELRSPPVWSRGKVLRVWGKKSPEAEAFCTFAHNILTPHGQKLGVSGCRGRQWIDTTVGVLEAVPSAGYMGTAPVQGSGGVPRS